MVQYTYVCIYTIYDSRHAKKQQQQKQTKLNRAPLDIETARCTASSELQFSLGIPSHCNLMQKRAQVKNYLAKILALNFNIY